MAETEQSRCERELETINGLPDRERLFWHLFDLQGESPRDRAWPTEGGNEPEPEPGWDPTGCHHYATVHGLYTPLQAEGAIPTDAAAMEEFAVQRYRVGKTVLIQIASRSHMERQARAHEWINQRSLALDEAVAAKLCAQPELLEVANANLARWAEQRGGKLPLALLERKDILNTWSLEQTLAELTNHIEKARRRRQSSPFSGILSPAERNAIFRQFDELLKAGPRTATPNPPTTNANPVPDRGTPVQDRTPAGLLAGTGEIFEAGGCVAKQVLEASACQKPDRQLPVATSFIPSRGGFGT